MTITNQPNRICKQLKRPKVFTRMTIDLNPHPNTPMCQSTLNCIITYDHFVIISKCKHHTRYMQHNCIVFRFARIHCGSSNTVHTIGWGTLNMGAYTKTVVNTFVGLRHLWFAWVAHRFIRPPSVSLSVINGGKAAQNYNIQI